jgi:hypothetical protein
MTALVRVNQDRQHPKALFDFLFARLSTHLQNVIGVHKSSPEQPLQLIVLGELVVFFGEFFQLCHEVLELFVYLGFLCA